MAISSLAADDATLIFEKCFATTCGGEMASDEEVMGRRGWKAEREYLSEIPLGSRAARKAKEAAVTLQRVVRPIVPDHLLKEVL